MTIPVVTVLSENFILCNGCGEVMTFRLTGIDVDDRDARVWNVSVKELHGKAFADRGYTRRELFEELFNRGIHLVHEPKADMKNKLMSMWNKIMLCKRYIVECISELLKNKADLVHSRRRPVHNFMMNIYSALTITASLTTNLRHYPTLHVERTKQLDLF